MAGMPSGSNGCYQRHRPELTLLYQVIEQHYPDFDALVRAQGRELPAFVQREFHAYLKCGRLEHGFLRVRCNDCHAEKLVAFRCKCRGFCPSCGARRTVDTAALLVHQVLPRRPYRQWVLSVLFALRFLFVREPAVMGSVLGIGVYTTRRGGGHRFVKTEAPTSAELNRLVVQIAKRVGRHLERQGLLVRDAENTYLEWDGEEASPLDDLAGHAITYRIAVGPNRGQKAFTPQTLPAIESEPDTNTPVASAAGFSLHAGVAARAHQRNKLERLCRYISRPAIAEPRLSLTDSGHIRYSLKTPWTDGTTHVLFEPLDFRRSCASLGDEEFTVTPVGTLSALGLRTTDQIGPYRFLNVIGGRAVVVTAVP